MLELVASIKLEVTLIDVPNILILENAIVNPNLSLLVGSNYEDVPLGVFTVDEISKDKSTVKLICYDNMIKFERTYFSNLSYPASINSVAQEICSKAGVQLATTLPSTLINKIEGYTYREAISFIASFLGGFARFNRIGKLEIVSYGTTNVEVTGDNYFKLNTSEKAFTIGRLACQVGENIISVGASGNEIKFENPIMTQVQLNNIFNTLKVLSYMPYSMDWQGNPALMAGDKIKIIDVKGNTFPTLLMQQKLSYKGGLSSTSKAVGKTEQAQEFSSNGSIKNKVERVVIEQANIKLALIEKATIEDLTVVNARIDNLYTTDLIAVNAKITNLEVHKADVIKLNAETARINDLYATKATIVDLTSARGKITLLETKVGSIDTILSKEIFVELMTAGKIVAGSSIIAEGAIGSAQISSLSGTKLSAGIIDATVITVKNLNADNITVGSINGKRIAEGAIDNSKVSDNANISGSKLNINDVIVNINGATTQINGTKIQVGDRTLDVELSTQKIVLEENKTTIIKQQATINAMDQAIKLKVDNQTFTQYKNTTDDNINTVSTNLNKATSSIEVLQKDIKLKVSQTEIDKSISEMDLGTRNLVLNSKILDKPKGVNALYLFRNLPINTTFTVCADYEIKIGNPKGFLIYCYNSANAQGTVATVCNIKEKYERMYITFTTSDIPGKDLLLYGGVNSTESLANHVTFTNVMLVEGNKAPKDWTPAPEDTDQAINQVDTKINTKVAEINVKLDNITLRVGKTEVATSTLDGKVNAMGNRVTTAESNINILNNSIALKVNQTEFDGLQNRVGQTEIKLQPDNITSTVFTNVKQKENVVIEERCTSTAVVFSQPHEIAHENNAGEQVVGVYGLNTFAQLTFEGTAIDVWTSKTNDSCIVDIFIDNVKKATVDLYSAPFISKAKIWSSGALTNGRHTIKVVNTNRKNPSSHDSWLNFHMFAYTADNQVLTSKSMGSIMEQLPDSITIGFNKINSGKIRIDPNGLKINNGAFEIVDEEFRSMFYVRKDGLSNIGMEIGTNMATRESYIDFHSNNSNFDYDSRILCRNGSASVGNGDLEFVAKNLIYKAGYLLYSPNIRRLTLAAASNYIEVSSTSDGVWGITAWASDVRLKHSIEDTDLKALGKVMRIKHRQFNFNRDNSHVDIGYIAQELQEINPQLVFGIKQEDGTDLLNPQTSTLLPLVSKALQELKIEKDQEIAVLKADINLLKKFLNYKES